MIVTVNIRELLPRIIGLPLLSEIPTETILKMVCVYLSYLRLTECSASAQTMFGESIEELLALPPSMVSVDNVTYAGLPNYPLKERPQVISLIKATIAILGNLLHSRLYAPFDWKWIELLGYNPQTQTMVIRLVQ